MLAEVFRLTGGVLLVNAQQARLKGKIKTHRGPDIGATDPEKILAVCIAGNNTIERFQ